MWMPWPHPVISEWEGPGICILRVFQMTVKSAEVSLAALCSVCVWGFCMRNARGRSEVTSQDE